MTMPAISLHQPWCSLCVTRQPCDCDPTWLKGHREGDHARTHPMVKRFETRSWPCPPALIEAGGRIIFHATAKAPPHGQDVGVFRVYGPSTLGDRVTPARIYERLPGWGTRPEIPIPLPLGAIVGSGRITACYPITGAVKDPPEHRVERIVNDLFVRHGWSDAADISDQLPYGDFTPGRYAWLIEDAAPTTERCPWCWGKPEMIWEKGYMIGSKCRTCDGRGRCDPIPAKGHQRIWNWEPT